MDTESVFAALQPVFPPIVDATGGYVTVADGRRYLDLAAQTLNMALGQRFSTVTAAVCEQAQRVHFASSRFATVPFLKLSERLAALAPTGLTAVALKLSNGSDAVETAIKIAVQHTRRPHVGCLPGAWHGETYLALGLASSHRGRLLADQRVAVAADEPTIAALTQLVTARSDLAAVILDPMLVAHGLPATDPTGDLRALRRACDARGVLLIFDEVQSFGWMATGLFTTEVHRTRPDLVCLGKALAGGLPLAAVVARDDLAAILAYNDAEFTAGGGPIPCAAALAVLDALNQLQPQLPGHASEFADALTDAFPRDDFDVRRVGLVATITPAPDRLRETWARRVLAECADAGVFVRATDRGRLLLIKPPLVLSMNDVREGLATVARIGRSNTVRMSTVIPATQAQASPAGSSVVVRKPIQANRHAGYVAVLLETAAPGLRILTRSPRQQQALTSALAGVGVPVTVTYAVAGQDAVDYGYVPGRTLQQVLHAPSTSAAWVNGLALRHYELVVRAHDHGVVIGDRWPGNAVVGARAELTLIDFEIGYDGPIGVAMLFEEVFAVVQTLAAVPSDHPIREDLSGRLVDAVVSRHGPERAAGMLHRLARFYIDPARPIHEDSGLADSYTGILWAALSRITGSRHPAATLTEQRRIYVRHRGDDLADC